MTEQKAWLERRKHARGFTLVEMLVVLVLTSLIATLLMQGMSFLWRLQSHYDDILNARAYQSMYVDWWRQSISGLLTDTPQGPDRFRGTAQDIHGLSLFAYGQTPGIPGRLAWSITINDGQTVLAHYHQAVFALPEGSRFAYLDDQRRKHDTWPPPQGLFPQLPAVVVILSEGQVIWAASPRQPQAPVAPDLTLGPGVTP